jgi:GT2 family glycosyltransferase
MPDPLLFNVLSTTRILFGRGLRAAFHRLPLGRYGKWRIKSFLYPLLAPLIRDTASYCHWKDEQTPPLVHDDEALVTITRPPLFPMLESGFLEAAGALSVPSTPDPVVTVLMPVYNQVGYTLCCLQSIAANPPLVPIEVVIIDDASIDETPQVIALTTGIRYIRNDTNQGFLRSVNRGASLARGRYLHILNNDTQVQAGWLDALVAVFEEETGVGIVGSKLIYPSGHLQEAGAALKRDGRVELIGLNADPSAATYARRRRVDHCSGASLLIEKTLFDRLGGFDEVYAPAYYEDCDLSLRVQAQGLDVIYEPRSVVIHHLSVSTNAEPSGKSKRIETNKVIFLERWARTLEDLDAVRLIAFYLPQFHPIPENDRWWGKGFTEWTNVTRAKPNFVGHDQPHLPADLGFYDLRLSESRQAQADLARQYGVYGFCYYYYWFSGKRLLHRPLDEVSSSGQPDFPFCICWANENWSRRWDGRESDILIGQQHSDDDDLAFILGLESLLLDSRYIRVHGRPLVLVYRIGLLPDAARTASIWREACRRSGVGEIFLASVQSFGATLDPGDFGFDAAVEFPPHERAVLLNPQPKMTNRAFKGLVYDYPATVEKFMNRPLPNHTFFRTAMPSWDNTARRQDTSNIFLNSTPDVYGYWLTHLIKETRELKPPGERLVFINAWNEWAEGNHLEPDQRHGHGYLEATRQALDAMWPPGVGGTRDQSQSDHRPESVAP